jgi:hypothetical protein
MTHVAFKLPNPSKTKLAYILLLEAPAGATEGELITTAVRRWDELHDKKIGEIVSLAESIREESESEMGRAEDKQRLEKWIRALLAKEPAINPVKAYELARDEKVTEVTLATFRNNFFYGIRTELLKNPKEALVLNEKPISEVDATLKEAERENEEATGIPEAAKGADAQEEEAPEGMGISDVARGVDTQLEPQGEIPDDHPHLQGPAGKGLMGIVEDEGSFEGLEGGGVAAEATGPFVPPNLDEVEAGEPLGQSVMEGILKAGKIAAFGEDEKGEPDRGLIGHIEDRTHRYCLICFTPLQDWKRVHCEQDISRRQSEMRGIDRKLSERYPGDDQSWKEGLLARGSAPDPNAVACETACTMEIDSPKGTISYELSVCGKVSVTLGAPGVDEFLELMEFLNGLLGPLTGKENYFSIPALTENEPEQEDEE